MERGLLLKSFQYKMFLSNAKFCDFDGMYSLYKKHLNGESGLSSFVLEELREIEQTNIDLDFLRQYDCEQYLKTTAEQIFSAINDYFKIDISVPIFFVDSFPNNFGLDSWKALSVDAMQAKHYSLCEGIYFKKEFVTPYMFEILLCHEIIHQVLPIVSKHFSRVKSSLDEEGLCDFFSYLILLKYSIIKDQNIIERFLTFNRGLSANINYIRYSYWNASMRAGILYAQYGKEEFFARYIKGGKGLSPSDFCEDLSGNACIISNKIKNMFIKISAILTLLEKEYVILKNISEGVTAEKLSSITGFSAEETVSICKTLQEKWLVYIENGKIGRTLAIDTLVYYYVE